MLEDIEKFDIRIKLISHFGNLPKEGLLFRSNSTWEPSKIHHTVKDSLNTWNSRRRQDQKNLNKLEMLAMENLEKWKDIVITKPNKGAVVVITKPYFGTCGAGQKSTQQHKITKTG